MAKSLENIAEISIAIGFLCNKFHSLIVKAFKSKSYFHEFILWKQFYGFQARKSRFDSRIIFWIFNFKELIFWLYVLVCLETEFIPG